MLTKGEFPKLMRKHKNEGKTSCFGCISPCLRERVAWRKEFIITSSSGIPAFDLSGHPWSTQLVRDDPDDTGFRVGGEESGPRRFRDATVHEEMEETKRSKRRVRRVRSSSRSASSIYYFDYSHYNPQDTRVEETPYNIL